METKEYIRILLQAGKLKQVMRHCWTMEGRQESVADHSWRIALMAMLLRQQEEFRDIDMDKVIRMCLIHDLGESFTGDIPVFLKKEADAEKEEDVYAKWVDTFPIEVRTEWQALMQEMQERQTLEAKTYKALDQLEALISHNESDLSTWLPLEYDLQYTYGKGNMEFSSFLKQLRKEIDAWTDEKTGGHHEDHTGE